VQPETSVTNQTGHIGNTFAYPFQHFVTRISGGNVGISRSGRDFQVPVGIGL
jgi:hypothetical protein